MMCIDLTGEDGLLHGSTSGQPVKELSTTFLENIRLKKQINAEAKNYVTRVENEVREKYAKKGHGEEKKHH